MWCDCMAVRLGNEAQMEDSREKGWGAWWRRVEKEETDHRIAIAAWCHD